MILFCTLGAIFLGIVLAVIIYTHTRKGSITVVIDFRQE